MIYDPFKNPPITGIPAGIKLLSLDLSPDNVTVAQELLPDSERERMLSFRHPVRQQAFAVGRLAARRLLGRALNCEPSSVRLVVRDDGSVAHESRAFHLSIAHSGAWAVAGIGPHAIGVDIERVRDRSPALYRFILHPDERWVIDRVALPDPQRIALFWSVKEAVLKGRRTGLRHSPKRLRIRPDALPSEALVDVENDLTWQVRSTLTEDYSVSVAWPLDAVTG